MTFPDETMSELTMIDPKPLTKRYKIIVLENECKTTDKKNNECISLQRYEIHHGKFFDNIDNNSVLKLLWNLQPLL